jgi:hypothetical protein
MGQIISGGSPVFLAEGGGAGTVQSVTAADASIVIGGTPTNPTVAVSDPLPAPTPNGDVLTVVGGAWTPAAPAAGGVASVAAGDTSIVIGGTPANPTVETATLDVIAADHPPVGAVGFNNQNLTDLRHLSNRAVANGAASPYVYTYGAGISGFTLSTLSSDMAASFTFSTAVSGSWPAGTMLMEIHFGYGWTAIPVVMAAGADAVAGPIGFFTGTGTLNFGTVSFRLFNINPLAPNTAYSVKWLAMA